MIPRSVTFVRLTLRPVRYFLARSLSVSAARPVGDSMPPLMQMPHIYKPQLSHSLRNWFLARTLITPYFDNDFSISEFSAGAKHAAVSVSNALAEGEMGSVENFLTEECLSVIKKNFSLFSKTQRSLLSIDAKDIYMSFVFQIGILMEDTPSEEEEGKHTRHVEITWVGHTFPDYLGVVEECGGNPVSVKRYMDERGGPQILNYRFIREFTKGVEDDWTINALNHWLIMDPHS